MSRAGTWSGWLVAAALAVAAAVRVARTAEPAKPGADETAAPVAPKAEVARQEEAIAPSEPPTSEPDVGEEAVPAEAEVVKDAWAPPGDIDSVEGLYAMLSKSTPQARELGRRLLAAYKAENQKAVLAAAREALNCPDPKVAAMAVEALRSTDEMPSLETAEAFLAFSGHENEYVKQRAVALFTSCISIAGDSDELSYDEAIDLSVRALTTIGSDSSSSDLCIRSAWNWCFGKRCLDPAAIDKAAAAFRDLAKSDDEERSKLGRWALCNIAADHVGRDSEMLYDDARIDRLLAERREEIAEAAARFPDNRYRARRYRDFCRDLKDEAKSRFGDDAEAAAAWIAEEKEFVARKLANGRL